MEKRSHIYRRVADAAAQDVANWPTWKRNATQVPLSERRSPEIQGARTTASCAGASERQKSPMPNLANGSVVKLTSPYGELRQSYLNIPNGSRGVILGSALGGCYLVEFYDNPVGSGKARVTVPSHWLTPIPRKTGR